MSERAESLPDAEGRPGRLLARAGWSEMLTRLLHRFAHDLNGRAMAIDAWVQIRALGRSPGHDVESEVDRLLAVAADLSRVPHAFDAPPEAIMPADVLAAALGLFDRLKAAAVEVEPGGPARPVLAGEHRLTAAMVLLLASVTPKDGIVNVSTEPEGEGVALRMSGAGTVIRADALDALVELLAIDGAALESDDSGVRFVWPSLAEARAATG